jgi:hypothetical protein
MNDLSLSLYNAAVETELRSDRDIHLTVSSPTPR